ncbi:MAG: hypothetical protein ACOVKS_04540 [Aquimonas sp.]
MTPSTYEEWRHCIQHICRVPLTPEFVATRIRELQDTRLHSTAQFLRHYGREHHARVSGWFGEAALRLQRGEPA